MYEEYLTKTLSNLIAAKQAVDYYNDSKIKDMKNVAAYHTQQAIEFLLKYCIYNNSKYNQGNSIVKEQYTHDLDKLITKFCVPYGIYIPSKIIKNAGIYTSWEAESRYSLSYSIRIDSIISAIETVEKWLISIKPSYKAKLSSVNQKLRF